MSLPTPGNINTENSQVAIEASSGVRTHDPGVCADEYMGNFNLRDMRGQCIRVYLQYVLNI
jgi:hypothetical protein